MFTEKYKQHKKKQITTFKMFLLSLECSNNEICREETCEEQGLNKNKNMTK